MERGTRSCLIWLVIVVVAPIVIAVAVWLIGMYRLERALDGRLASLQAAGDPTTLLDAAPKPVPDDENAAVLYQQVFQVQFGAPPSTIRSLDGLSKQHLEALDAYRKAPGGATTEAARGVLASAAARDSLDTLRRASELPHSVFPINWGDHFAAGTMRHMTKFRDATGLAAAQACLAAQDGDTEQALAWYKVGFRMSQHAASEPTLTAQLVSIAMQAMLLRPLKQWLRDVDLRPEAAEEFERFLRRIDVSEAFTHALKGERAMGMDACSDPRMVSSMLPSSQRPPGAPGHVLFGGIARCFWMREEVIWIDRSTEGIEATQCPYCEAQPKLAAFESRLKGLGSLHGGILTAIILPVQSKAIAKRYQAVAELDLLRTTLALKALKARTGAYPRDLAALQKTLDWKLPKDPFSGKDFIYRLKGNGFILYSLGPNLKDDGGVALQVRSTPPAGDIAWECAR